MDTVKPGDDESFTTNVPEVADLPLAVLSGLRPEWLREWAKRMSPVTAKTETQCSNMAGM